MSMFRVMGICLIVFAVGVRLGAQGQEGSEADAWLKRVAESYATQPHMEVTAYTRELRVEEMHDAESSTPTYRAASAEYGRLVLTRRLPDDWRIVSQLERVSRGEVQPSRTLVFAKIGDGDSSMLLLNASTKATARMGIPAGMFQQEVNERIGRTGMKDPFLRLFFGGGTAARGDWAVFFGRGARLRVEGEEEVEGVRLTRIVSSWPPSSITRLWIDTEKLTLVRVLETPGEPSVRMGMPLEVKETLYRHDFGKGALDADFDLDAGWAAATPNIASAAGFSPSTVLFAGLVSGGTIKPEKPVAKNPSAPKLPARPPVDVPAAPTRPGDGRTAQSPVAPSTPPPAPEPPAVEEQLLTREQMEAIVLVDGDEGVGTGFIATIRGVNFVVTNLHVIGGNASIRVTTVRGQSVRVGGMFGAAGRDIAILRIESEYAGPTLKLAEDPLATVKLGDKVAVVGNRRGGGVATQVSGVV
ncbi:MAG: trypsin-like peptidase domain-containing protein, partial [Burkholderiales bacterium]|nr:trypsin-like peptidase domain-containing protein [Opitutaceae bacterium]